MHRKRRRAIEPEVSEKEVLLLGLVAEEPLHAYGLNEKIKTRRLTDWTDISSSSVYRVLYGLEKNGFLDFELKHEGQGATRKLYRITESGRRALAAGVLELLSFTKPVTCSFQAGLAFLTHAPHGEVMAKLRDRASILDQRQAQLESTDSRARPGFPVLKEVGEDHTSQQRQALNARLFFDYIKCHLAAERQFVEDTLELLARVDIKEIFDKAHQRHRSDGRQACRAAKRQTG